MARDSSLTDIKTLRTRARLHIDVGSVTAGYAADREAVLKLLNASLATELVCVLRYRRHHFMNAGLARRTDPGVVLRFRTSAPGASATCHPSITHRGDHERILAA